MASASKEYYDRYWSDEELFLSNELDAQVVELIEPLTGPDADCLDVGCGDGRTTGRWLQERCRSYTGVDVSQQAVDKARARGLDASVIEDASRLPFGDREFDLVVCVEVLEHVFEPHIAAREILRVLRPGGALVATVPNVTYWKRRVEAVAGRWNPMGDLMSVEQPWRDPHIRFFNVASLGRMLHGAGFTSVEIHGHKGCFVHDPPYFPRIVRQRRSSNAYRALEAQFPSLLGWRLAVVARKPPTA